MDADPEIKKWILEFLLRQSLENRTLKSVLRALPPPDDNHYLKKLLLLKKLESDISRNSVSETNLDILAYLAQTEFLLGNKTVSATMRKAFCAAAVECTIKSLKAGDCEAKDVRFKLYDAVKRVWKKKIEVMKKFEEKGGLGSDELWEWKIDVEKALWSDDIYASVLQKSDQIDGVEALNAYIREERERMGPSFLELLADRLKSDENLQKILEVAGKGAPASGVGEHAGGSKEKNERNIKQATELESGNPNEPRPNLVGRKTARTPDLDESEEGRGMNLKKRRKKRWWSPEEEDVLRNAVTEHGKGNWNLILRLNKGTFGGRTEVDLKDKWRNMTTPRNTPRL